MVAGYLQVVWLLLGTWEIASGHEVPQRRVRLLLTLGLLAGVLSALSLVVVEVPERPLLRVGVRSLVAAVAYVVATAALLQPTGRRPRTFGRRLMALALIGYSVNQSAYFLLTVVAGPMPIVGLATVGMFDLLAQALLALAIVIWLLEDERADALAAVGERERRERAQACVYRISDAAHSVRDLPELFQTIHASIGEVIPARNFYIALYDRSEDKLSFPYFVDAHDTTPEPKPPGRARSPLARRLSG
jgi:hypothetical protein